MLSGSLGAPAIEPQPPSLFWASRNQSAGLPSDAGAVAGGEPGEHGVRGQVDLPVVGAVAALPRAQLGEQIAAAEVGDADARPAQGEDRALEVPGRIDVGGVGRGGKSTGVLPPRRTSSGLIPAASRPSIAQPVMPALEVVPGAVP